MIHRCEHCHLSGGRYGSSKLCGACIALGWRWCCLGRHVVGLCEYKGWTRCYECSARQDCENHPRLVPPPGYVSIPTLARQINWSRRWIHKQLQRGWMAGHTWRRCKRGRWFVEYRDTYPPWLYL